MAASVFTLNNVADVMGMATAPVEQDIFAKLTQLQNNPNPSQQDFIQFQLLIQKWSALVQLDSSILKVTGDTYKQLATNVGS